MDCVVSPLLHNHELPALAVSVTDSLAQNVVGPPAVIVAVGNGFTVTLWPVDVFEQPFAFVTVTDRVDVLLTVMDCVVSPELHSHELPALAVSITDSSAQKVVAPEGVIVAAGRG